MSNLSKYNFYLQCIADAISIILAYSFAYWWRFRGPQHFPSRLVMSTPGSYSPGVYTMLLPGIIISYLIVAYFMLMKEDFIRRSFAGELKSVTKTVLAVLLIVIIYLFFSKSSLSYSRAFIGAFAIAFWFLCLILRLLLKKYILPLVHAGKNVEQIVVVGRLSMIKKRLHAINDTRDWRVKVVGLVVTDADMEGEYVDGIKVLANRSNMGDVIKDASTDSVVIVPYVLDDTIREWAKMFHDVGKIVHLDFDQTNIIPAANHVLDMVGSCPVISFYPLKKISIRFLMIKRFLDIVLSVLLLPLFFVLFILSLLLLNIESRGPVLVSRVRVGKNGRRFNQLRFRIFRMDAKERIAQGKNPKTVWGRFLSFSHFDRLPLILNVLFSDMSFVGPHAPRLPRFLEYSSERRKNLCMRPGIIGRWSFELNEDLIIREERRYIEKWSFLQDIALIAEFILRWISGNLVRSYDDEQAEEEIGIIDDFLEFRKPFEYEHNYTPRRGIGVAFYHFVKRLVDIALSALAIVILSPLFLVLMILVISDDGGTPFYAHERIGKNGKRIHVYKFRSMRKDPGDIEKLLTPEQLEQYKKEFKIDNDPRITKIGNFLRRSSLDELPQLFNILGGSLSIIGPRPIVASETEMYGSDVAKLLSVKPGLTGYWQAYARNNAKYENGERQAMEMYYVDHASIGFDIKIFFKTIGSVAKGTGAQ